MRHLKIRIKKLIEGIKKHYDSVCAEAEKKISELSKNFSYKIPLIATGHLFTAGGKCSEGDGVRDLYVGSLAHIEKNLFPSVIDYLALGHLHVPQKVGGEDNIRYSGSPIPMGFGEAKQEKKVITVDFNQSSCKINEITVPCFQKLERISGDLNNILDRIDHLRFESSSAWLEIEYTGKEPAVNLRESLENAVSGTSIEIRRIKNRQFMQKLIKKSDKEEELDDLSEQDVFRRCLDSYDVPENERTDLISAYSEIINLIREEDLNAE